MKLKSNRKQTNYNCNNSHVIKGNEDVLQSSRTNASTVINALLRNSVQHDYTFSEFDILIYIIVTFFLKSC